MPHCGRRLYSNVLRANWTPRQLANVAIFGNRSAPRAPPRARRLLPRAQADAAHGGSFEEYGLRLLDASARGSCCVSRLATCDLCCEAVLPAFSDQGSFQVRPQPQRRRPSRHPGRVAADAAPEALGVGR